MKFLWNRLTDWERPWWRYFQFQLGKYLVLVWRRPFKFPYIKRYDAGVFKEFLWRGFFTCVFVQWDVKEIKHGGS